MSPPPSDPRIAVVIPTRDRARLVGDAIGSVLAQGFREFELVIVDDGSEDETPRVVESFGDPRIRLLRQASAGPGAARNRGVRAARAPYVTFLDSDDLALEGWLSDLVEGFEAHGAEIVFCGAIVEAAGRGGESIERPADLGPAFGGLTGLFTGGGVYALGRDLFLEAGGFDPEAVTSEHTELGLRLAGRWKERGLRTWVVDAPRVRYRAHPGERLFSDPEKRLRGTRYLLRAHREELRRDRALLADCLAVAGVSAYRTGRPAEGRAWLLRSFRARPLAWKSVVRLLLGVTGLHPARWRAG